MNNIAFLQNVASSTRLPEGSIQDLMKRVAKVEANMTDIEKAKLDTAIADAFTSVSSVLDQVETARGGVPTAHTNAAGLPRYGSKAWIDRIQANGMKPPSSNDKIPLANTGGGSFQLPKAAD